MLKRFATLVVLALAVLTLTACGSKSLAPAPEMTELVVPAKWLAIERYPVIAKKHVMTDAELQQLGLRRDVLMAPTLMFNHYRELGRDRTGGWRHEVLPAGTWVAVDRDGRAWYKLDCSNRLYAPVEAKKAATLTPPPPKKYGETPWWWSPWWLVFLIPAAAGYLPWWLLRGINRDLKKEDGDFNRFDPDPGAGPIREQKPGVGVGTTAAGVAAATAATAARPDANGDDPTNALYERMGAVERDVAEIREAVTGLEDRVVTRLEPTVRQAVEDGGKARARNALAEQIAILSTDAGNAEMITALTRAMETLGS